MAAAAVEQFLPLTHVSVCPLMTRLEVLISIILLSLSCLTGRPRARQRKVIVPST